MKKNSYFVDYEQLKDINICAFGFELLREALLPDLLGQDHTEMLYWAGKRLARKYPVETVDELTSFFSAAGWGTLTLIHNKKDEMVFELSSELISNRLKASSTDFSFQLEAGFIAEQIQQINKQITESFEQVKKRAKKVIFTVKSDSKDKI
ncbi:YslB family protein [Metabacillus fastidiosus]|uniref:YslB family protein n=1 Tax=Metabacillus fastidiosus TaxID=1458 RepID=A0ABU6NW60_9BACI|nr:YslB family protein [Metabacillus fastidiosus]MED4401140.1 YslB family protein [Metabacillus fastidiosus]MED4453284.1 YslB family protein [Metabacillus fastidiosus]MED4464066.1 YslB family protein [Metabacillus fastidiosus]